MSLKISMRDTMTSFLTVTATLGSVCISMDLNSFTFLICRRNTQRERGRGRERHIEIKMVRGAAGGRCVCVYMVL